MNVINMTIGDKIKLLRKEKGWSQDELSEKIGIDGRQISRYENGKFFPSAEVIINIAQVFDVSIDFLLLDGVERKPIHLRYESIIRKLQEIDRMTDEDENSLMHFLEAISAKNKLVSLADTVRQ
jgi:transcriptional regulator with XRE-family HTH domain